MIGVCGHSGNFLLACLISLKETRVKGPVVCPELSAAEVPREMWQFQMSIWMLGLPSFLNKSHLSTARYPKQLACKMLDRNQGTLETTVAVAKPERSFADYPSMTPLEYVLQTNIH